MYLTPCQSLFEVEWDKTLKAMLACTAAVVAVNPSAANYSGHVLSCRLLEMAISNSSNVLATTSGDKHNL
jgi:hypothetical protein